jgi:hypothetical protein
MVIASAPFEVGAQLSLGGVTKTPTCFAEMGVIVEVSDASWDELVAARCTTCPGLKSEPPGRRPRMDGPERVVLQPVVRLRSAHTGKLAEIMYG